MKIAVALKVRYEAMAEVAAVADDLGFESVWLPEHLVFPARLAGSPSGGDHPPVSPDIPTYDVLVFLVTLAQATRRIRLGTWVYNLALRHPIVAARAVQTLDIVSGGRVLFGVGAGWIPEEYAALGVDFASRGQRLDECIEVLRLLWTEDEPTFDGEFFRFPPVRFEPKPVQGAVPIHVGGESAAALRRSAVLGDGWIGMDHTPPSAAAQVGRLRRFEQRAGRGPVEVSVGGTPPDADGLRAYAAAGVDRLLVAPWERTRGAVAGLRRYADEVVRPYEEERR